MCHYLKWGKIGQKSRPMRYVLRQEKKGRSMEDTKEMINIEKREKYKLTRHEYGNIKREDRDKFKDLVNR